MGWFDNMFGSSSSDANKYMNKLDPMYHQYYDPYVQQGQRISPELEEQYRMLMQNPNMAWDQMAQGYEQSPGYQFQYNQAMNAGNNAAAAGGMLGTGQHQQMNAQIGSDLANQDFYNYMSQMLGQQGLGIQGMQGLYNTGFDAATGLAGNLGSTYLNRANMAQNQAGSMNQMLGTALGGGAGFLMGGPTGAMAGAKMGNGAMGGNGFAAGGSGGWKY